MTDEQNANTYRGWRTSREPRGGLHQHVEGEPDMIWIATRDGETPIIERTLRELRERIDAWHIFGDSE